MSYPKTFQELIRAHGKVALELSGAGQSAWNGLVKETDNGVLGMADWNGTLELDQDAVTDPLREMYASPGTQHSAAKLAEFRDAFATLLHEQSHFLGPVGATQQDAKVAFQTTSAAELEEGVTEAWTQDNLNEYLTRLGADQIAPGIENATNQHAYPELVPAARELAAGIGARAGLSEGEVLRTLNGQTAAGQWSTATDMLYTASNLPNLVPSDQEATVKNSIEQVMRTEYQRLDKLQLMPSHNKEILSASIGQDTVSAALNEIDRQEKIFAPPQASSVQTLSNQNLSNQTGSTLATAAQTGPSLGTQNTAQNTTSNNPAGPTNGQTNGQARTAGATPAPGAAGPSSPAVAATRTVSSPQHTAAGVQTAVSGPAGAAEASADRAGAERSGSGGAAVGAAAADGGASADTRRALALAQSGQQPLSRPMRLAESDFGSRRGGDHGAGQAQTAERPSGQRGGRGE